MRSVRVGRLRLVVFCVRVVGEGLVRGSHFVERAEAGALREALGEGLEPEWTSSARVEGYSLGPRDAAPRGSSASSADAKKSSTSSGSRWRRSSSSTRSASPASATSVLPANGRAYLSDVAQSSMSELHR